MIIKKNSKKNLERFKVVFFVIGLNLTLALVWTAFEWKQYDILENNISEEMAMVSDLEMVEITQQIEEPEPPKKPEIIKTIEIRITDEKVDDKIDVFVWEGDEGEVDEYNNNFNDEKEVEGEDDIFVTVGKMPEFPGGELKMLEFIRDNTVYPKIAKNAGITGIIYVSFVIEKDGSISDVKLAKGGENIGGGCLEESIRVVNLMPNWSPGEQRHQKVRVRYVLPIQFSLSSH